jgi:hypothetical protein
LRRLILHAGTPKTGTTSLQRCLQRNRNQLREHGILYPDAVEAPPSKPKHQWVVGALMGSDGSELTRRIRLIEAEAEAEDRVEIHTIVLSTEGIYHHWWDFSAAGRGALASLAAAYSMEVWTWFRDPLSFARSNYVQMLKNPRGYVPCYGLDLSIDEMFDDPWFARQLDYAGFIRDVESLLGAGTVKPFAYHRNTVDAFFDTVGIAIREHEHTDAHRTPGAVGVEMLRLLNRHALSDADKASAVSLITRLDDTMGARSGPVEVMPAVQDKIRRLAHESLVMLQRDYGISLSPVITAGTVAAASGEGR